jgi:uncharacterized membrane protein
MGPNLKGSGMDYIIGWIIGLAVFALVVAVLFFVITRGVRAVLGPRRRLEEELSVSLLRGRLARGEISQDEFDQAARIMGAQRP